MVLALLGAWQITEGIVAAVTPRAYPAGASVIHEMIPGAIRAGMWIGCGLLAIVAARFVAARSVGWIVLTLMPVQCAISHLYAGLMWLIPDGPAGRIDSLPRGIGWVVLLAAIILCAGWPEHPAEMPTRRTDKEARRD